MAEISSIINTPDTSATAQTEGVVTPMAAENNQIVEHDSALTLDGQNEQTKATPPVMASQGNPNGPAPAPATAPATAPVAAASRAPSAAPTPSAMPAEAAEHGAATRVYMNTKVTYHLLAGMKELAKHKPENPLRVLGEFLLARSAQYETGSVTTTSTAAGTSAAAGEDHIMGEE